MGQPAAFITSSRIRITGRRMLISRSAPAGRLYKQRKMQTVAAGSEK